MNELETLKARIAKCEKQIEELLLFKADALRLVSELNAAKLADEYRQRVEMPPASEVETIVLGGGEQPPLTEEARSHREFVKNHEFLTYSDMTRDPAEYLSRPLPQCVHELNRVQGGTE